VVKAGQVFQFFHDEVFKFLNFEVRRRYALMFTSSVARALRPLYFVYSVCHAVMLSINTTNYKIAVIFSFRVNPLHNMRINFAIFLLFRRTEMFRSLSASRCVTVAAEETRMCCHDNRASL